jgi:hypothetical protein
VERFRFPQRIDIQNEHHEKRERDRKNDKSHHGGFDNYTISLKAKLIVLYELDPPLQREMI